MVVMEHFVMITGAMKMLLLSAHKLDSLAMVGLAPYIHTCFHNQNVDPIIHVYF